MWNVDSKASLLLTMQLIQLYRGLNCHNSYMGDSKMGKLSGIIS